MPWVLILTLMYNGNTNGGNSITNIPGFFSLKSCQEAGNAWLYQVNNTNPNVATKAICIQLK